MGNDRIHPQTMHEVRRLVNLHGADAIIAAIKQIKKEQTDAARSSVRPVARRG